MRSEHAGSDFATLPRLAQRCVYARRCPGRIRSKNRTCDGKAGFTAIRLERDAGAIRPETGAARRGLVDRGVVHFLGGGIRQLVRAMGSGHFSDGCSAATTPALHSRAAGLDRSAAELCRRLSPIKLLKQKARAASRSGRTTPRSSISWSSRPQQRAFGSTAADHSPCRAARSSGRGSPPPAR